MKQTEKGNNNSKNDELTEGITNINDEVEIVRARLVPRSTPRKANKDC